MNVDLDVLEVEMIRRWVNDAIRVARWNKVSDDESPIVECKKILAKLKFAQAKAGLRDV